jgi:hypothetical protein
VLQRRAREGEQQDQRDGQEDGKQPEILLRQREENAAVDSGLQQTLAPSRYPARKKVALLARVAAHGTPLIRPQHRKMAQGGSSAVWAVDHGCPNRRNEVLSLFNISFEHKETS